MGTGEDEEGEDERTGGWGQGRMGTGEDEDRRGWGQVQERKSDD